jgi:hypothetical protein
MRNRWQRKVTTLIHVMLASTLCPLLASCGGPSLRGAPRLGTPALSLSAGKVLAAIGMKPQGGNGTSVEDATLQDRRVAFGLTHLLAESFYDTGKFRLVEEKDLYQRQLIEELVDLFSSTSRPSPSNTELGSIGARLEADLLTYGKVGYTKSSGQRIQIGPVGRYQQQLRINVEVCLFEVSSQTALCRAGEGAAQQEGVGAVYEFRNDRPAFEKNAAGRATKQAVTSAVEALMASLRFIP